MRHATAALALLATLAGGSASAQNAISQDGWEGFAVRDVDNRLDHCVLYNRTIRALTASPYEMIGITRDTSGRIGLLVFFNPRSLTRGEAAVEFKFDQRPLSVTGQVLSDFHLSIPALEADMLAALSAAKEMNVRAGERSLRVELKAVGHVIDRLAACVATYGPKT